MRSVAFDVDVIPSDEVVEVVFHVPTSTDWQSVQRLIECLAYAFAVAEFKTLDEMVQELATMMTITRADNGMKVQLKRPSRDPSYFTRFDAALCGQALQVH